MIINKPGPKTTLTVEERKKRDKEKQKLYKQSEKYKIYNREYCKKYYYENYTKQQLRARKYHQAHKEEEQQYRLKNKEKIKIYLKTWRQTQYDTNPEFRLKCLLRSRLQKLFKIQKIHKNMSSLKLVGCTILELKQYLESKFLKEMTWDNRSEWHIDHIRPCSSFDLNDIEEQKKCFHYTNLQPLWAIDNLKKNATWNN